MSKNDRLGDPWIASLMERIVELENARDHAVAQAQVWAQEARTQRSTVLEILRLFDLPLQDWNAVELMTKKKSELE